MYNFNLFDGESYCAMFAQVAYKLMMSRKWITYADVMAKYMMLDSTDDLPYSVSNCDNYVDLKKAISALRNAISEKVGGNCFEERGNNRGKSFRYVGEDDDPLADMRNAKVVSNLKQYWQFCQDSAGFFPTSWLDYFFKDTKDLLDIKSKKKRGEQVLSTSLDRFLKNIELLPYLYESIINKQVLIVEYKPFDMDLMTLTFHPHYLKEYNGRWHLYGHAEGMQPEFGFDIALDRIVNKPREINKVQWIPAPAGFYESFFADVIGVSHNMENRGKREIRVRAHSNYIYNLIVTKKIHQTQETVLPFGEHEDGKYGEFSIQVELNNELFGTILRMGPALEVVSPPEVRESFRKRIKDMLNLYEDTP